VLRFALREPAIKFAYDPWSLRPPPPFAEHEPTWRAARIRQRVQLRAGLFVAGDPTGCLFGKISDLLRSDGIKTRCCNPFAQSALDVRGIDDCVPIDGPASCDDGPTSRRTACICDQCGINKIRPPPIHA